MAEPVLMYLREGDNSDMISLGYCLSLNEVPDVSGSMQASIAAEAAVRVLLGDACSAVHHPHFEVLTPGGMSNKGCSESFAHPQSKTLHEKTW
jgi:hypothetical protein